MSDEPGMALAKLVDDAAPEVREALEATGALDVLRQGVGIVGDRVWLRRQERFAVGLAEAARRLQERGIPLAAISDKTLRAVYEHLSVEEDEDLRGLWVKLLESALAGELMPPVYPEVLRQMEPLEARFFDAVWQAQTRFLPQPGLSLDQIEENARAILPELKWRHLDNLERLGLLSYSWHGPVNVERPNRPVDAPLDVVCSLTPLGEDFIAYCSQ
jgi:hypothetical protein